ncbi:hypothetical protein M422DRAFT_246215 [Sphaerobolus stellatus SS14]|nr:hypothetical protein M422DRAFT_246215 [Sphaerobolus stellatus SS14]
MHIVLTGATGTCGSAVLKHLLSEPRVTRISVLSRRPISQAKGQEKVNVILHDDFAKYPKGVLEQLKGADACIWALGISSASVPKEYVIFLRFYSNLWLISNYIEYVKITYDYPVAAAKAFSSLAPSLNFVFVSGEGADQSESSWQIFARIKGKAEKDLIQMGEQTPSLNIYAARPGFIDPEGNRIRETPEPLTKRAYVGAMGFVFGNLYKPMHIGTFPLAKALTLLALGDGKPLPAGTGIEFDGRVLRNTALRKLAGI